ncbi:septal ring lytic transglycosylase RlpA family protein [Prosthecomicrobium sp. N25]|uniref:septal ring lytic transglycosylase RlpA family protein n=1 Tax=Prosthecomicrobium sp. N25 TaxID=3129254 RepID=UPI0030784F67
MTQSFRCVRGRRSWPAAGLVLTSTVLAGCSASTDHAGVDPKYGVSASRRVVADGDPVPKGGGRAQVGKPYTIGGRVYVPQEDPAYDRTGVASWYGHEFHGRETANGEVYDRMSISAAHPTMPLPSYAKVTNLANGRSIVVRVNDRGPYAGNREIDVSERAADLLGFKGRGITRVRVQYAGRAPLEGSDDTMLASTLTEGADPVAVTAMNGSFGRSLTGTLAATFRPAPEPVRTAAVRPQAAWPTARPARPARADDDDPETGDIGDMIAATERQALPAAPPRARPGPVPQSELAPPPRWRSSETARPRGLMGFASAEDGPEFPLLRR